MLSTAATNRNASALCFSSSLFHSSLQNGCLSVSAEEPTPDHRAGLWALSSPPGPFLRSTMTLSPPTSITNTEEDAEGGQSPAPRAHA